MDYLDEISIITSSKEFRRMQDKTQLFYSNKGDHYRTRLTHTLEVYAIALEIARSITNKKESETAQSENASETPNPFPKFDDRLIAAIALGHDVGHTPFGHIGERVLSAILEGRDNLGGLIASDTFDTHCFKHNINSYRILSQIETATGIRRNLSWEVLDGVLKHTKVYKDKDPSVYLRLSSMNQNDPYLLKKVLLRGNLKKIANEISSDLEYIKHNCALTLEGQIVALADEIAQRVSDFDDAARAGYWVTINKSFVKLSCTNFYKNNYSLIENIKNSKENKSVQKLCENLRKFLIKSVQYEQGNDKVRKLEKLNSVTIHTQKCIDFDDAGQQVNQIFDEINQTYIIRCEELRKCDGTSQHIIRQIFKAYYNNFSQLGDSCIETICNDVYRKVKAIIKIRKTDDPQIKEREIIVSSAVSVSKFKNLSIDGKITLLDGLKQILNRSKYESPSKETSKSTSVVESFLTELSYEKKDLKSELLLKDLEIEPQYARRQELIKELHRIILHDIALYIAGMTDSFAYEEYHRLYGISNI